MKADDTENWKYQRVAHAGDFFTVSIHAYWDNRWCWNVYAYIYEGHELFDKPEKWGDLHFHGGISLDQIITTEPALGIKNKWQKVHRTVKIGSDYNHIWNVESQIDMDPSDGEPAIVVSDAKRLAEQLKTFEVTE